MTARFLIRDSRLARTPLGTPLERTVTTRHPILEEWQQQLAKLNRLIESRTRSTWLYEIRVKILKYVISRYGHQTLSENEFGRSRSGRGALMAYVAVDASRRCGAAPKTPEIIRALLQDIQQNVHPATRQRSE